MDIGSLMGELMSADATLLKLGLGSVFGLCLGLTGVGGGVLLIPMLQLFCDMSPVLAVGTASLISALVKVNASIMHIKTNNVSWKQISFLFAGALPATLLVTQIVVYFNNHPTYQQLTQQLIEMLVMLVMAGALLSVCMKYRSSYVTTATSNPQLSIGNGERSNKVAVFSGMFCGSVLGSTGVGGGVLLLPILNSFLNINIKKAIGSSVVLALFLSAITALSYAKGGQADVITALWFVLGSIAGVALAGTLMHKLSEKHTYLITIGVISISILLYVGV